MAMAAELETRVFHMQPYIRVARMPALPRGAYAGHPHAMHGRCMPVRQRCERRESFGDRTSLGTGISFVAASAQRRALRETLDSGARAVVPSGNGRCRFSSQLQP
jgi:hypothetical protein